MGDCGVRVENKAAVQSRACLVEAWFVSATSSLPTLLQASRTHYSPCVEVMYKLGIQECHEYVPMVVCCRFYRLSGYVQSDAGRSFHCAA